MKVTRIVFLSIVVVFITAITLFMFLRAINALSSFQSCEYMRSSIHVLFMFYPRCSEHSHEWVTVLTWIIPAVMGTAIYRHSKLLLATLTVTIVLGTILYALPNPPIRADFLLDRDSERRYDFLGAWCAFLIVAMNFYWQRKSVIISYISIGICTIVVLLLFLLLPLREAYWLSLDYPIFIVALAVPVAPFLGFWLNLIKNRHTHSTDSDFPR